MRYISVFHLYMLLPTDTRSIDRYITFPFIFAADFRRSFRLPLLIALGQYLFFLPSIVAFLLRALTSVLSGFLEMKIATYANARTTLEARKGVDKAFVTAFRSGAAMGFLLAGNDLLVHYNSFNVFKLSYGDVWEGLYKSITGYVLGGSSVALFGRVGGEIYTKAADVEVEQNIPEESSKPSCDCR
ncbi:H(+)-exporting diphosphatase [Heracleum sosnowskyi]|uniref:H(+)-exporting diphosphatase n=1 Tax=Heracleum sosnowskyi TaxID=360622 RepID=A0AAD8MNG5_9APIA|nr:H(+)-exporting diphosphatase [Heracleum sosnowskyi]